MRIGYLECFSGISGDMLLGAMVDAGVSFDCLERTAAALGVGARLEMRKVSRGGLAATKVDVITDEGSGVRDQGSEGTGNREQKTNTAMSMGTAFTTTSIVNTSMSTIIPRTPTRRTAPCRRLSPSFAPRRSQKR